MKKIMVTFAMAVVMVMSVMVIGPEKAFAAEAGVNKHDEVAIRVLENNYERVLNNRSEEFNGSKLTLVSQDISWFEELGVYEWHVKAYDYETHMFVEDTVRVAPEDLDGIIEMLMSW